MGEPQNQPAAPPSGRNLRLLWWLFNQGLGHIGWVLVLYSIVAALTEPWVPLEKYATFISSLLTLFGVIVTAASVYVTRASYHRPWTTNKRIVAPIVIGACAIAIFFLFWEGQLPVVMVNGFAMLGLSGGLQRLIPTNPQDLTA